MTRSELIEALRKADGGSRELDIEIMCEIGSARRIDNTLFYGPGEISWYCGEWKDESSLPPLPYVTTSLVAAIALVERVRPGWYHTSGECYLTGHATIGADYNDPAHSERLHREFPIGDFNAEGADYEREQWIFSEDLEGGENRQARALLICLLESMEQANG